MTSKSPIKTIAAAAFAVALATAGTLAWSAPAEARMGGGGGFHGGGGGFHGGGGGFRGGMGGGFRGGFAGPGFARPGFAGPGFVRPGFVRPGFAGPGFVRPGFAGSRFHHRRFFFGPAFAFGAPFYYGAPYYYSNYYGDDGCYYVLRRHVDRWGYVVARRALVCY